MAPPVSGSNPSTTDRPELYPVEGVASVPVNACLADTDRSELRDPDGTFAFGWTNNWLVCHTLRKCFPDPSGPFTLWHAEDPNRS